ncbi:DUF3316 domain-containing protein [Proteiniphilum sp. UBA1028]|jgi:hypothetical protein|uniref:DUF3316 domain-containing protein n=1 Tax=Proteiniphilum sp. UBA1028 TaxID=1947251 RepID=UPI000E81C80C|nr:DUF3316 domain-containing protein [Proteiniphilum sp. UBA1028]HBG58289.1 hypothetical protein [Porphyromonadaceae bacterium]
MRRTVALIIVWISFFCGLFSQEHLLLRQENTVNHSTLFGIGKAYLSDSYLSPLTYSGMSMTLMHDRLKRSPYFAGELLLQQQFQIQVGITENPTASASEYYGDIRYYLTSFYPLIQTSRFKLLGGPGWEASLGGIYNVRNSNNPGSLKVSTNLNLSAMALCSFRWGTLRWQLSTPFVGLFFSPEYGHSYYEIFTLGNNKGTVHLGSFHNQLALRNYFTVDVPLNRITLRAGYLGDYYQTDVNELSTKIVNHQFLLGLAFESLNFGGRKVRHNEMLKSSYY